MTASATAVSRRRHAGAGRAADDDVEGPFDIEDFDDPEEALLARLDLGSVLIPMPPGGQVQVEFNQTGVPSAIWVVTANGRFTIAAYAAPKSPGLWREVAAELADALRNDNAAVSIEDGPWGREVVGTRRRRGPLHRGRRLPLDDPLRGQRRRRQRWTHWWPRRGKRWRTPSFAAVTLRCRCEPRCRSSCPSNWPRSCGPRPRPSRPSRPSSPAGHDRRPAGNARSTAATVRSRIAAPQGQRTESGQSSPRSGTRSRSTEHQYRGSTAARRSGSRQVPPGTPLPSAAGRARHRSRVTVRSAARGAPPPPIRRPPPAGWIGSSGAAATPIGAGSRRNSATVGRDVARPPHPVRRAGPATAAARTGPVRRPAIRARRAHGRGRGGQTVAAQRRGGVPCRHRGGCTAGRAGPRRQGGQHRHGVFRMGQRPVGGHRRAQSRPRPRRSVRAPRPPRPGPAGSRPPDRPARVPPRAAPRRRPRAAGEGAPEIFLIGSCRRAAGP